MQADVAKEKAIKDLEARNQAYEELERANRQVQEDLVGAGRND